MHAELYDYMGTDVSVVNAARVSFSKESDFIIEDDGTLTVSDADIKLINYLARHQHWTPFAHTAITVRMKAPIPIRTQCFKHKVGLVENEESRRYVSHTPDVFNPEFRKSVKNKKQGSGAAMTAEELVDPEQIYKYSTYTALKAYEALLDKGVCEEQARFVLPQGAQVEWFWTGNLVSFAGFYNKRTDPNAQQEIQELAKMVGDTIAPLFPVSWNALTGQ